MDPQFYIETPRLFLSYFIPENPKHCKFLVTLYNSPEFIAAEGKTDVVDDKKAQQRIAGRLTEEHKRHGYGTYLLSLKTTPTTAFADALPIGSVSLTQGLDADAMPAPDIGFAIIPEETKKGYATEAVKHVIEYAAREKGLKEVFGFCNPNNPTSARVLEKVGMDYRGLWKIRAFGNQTAKVFAIPGMKDIAEYNIGEAA